jgi:hypothetical protein
VLGLTYADLYRRLTINESVYEALTKEYELARVQEAKEVPSVKVMDPAELPERRTGPPRVLITICGTLLSFCMAGIWLFCNEAWTNTDDRNPRKILASEILLVARNTVQWNRTHRIALKMNPFRFRRQFYSNPGQGS